MRQLKVYKNLTQGYNLAIFALCLVIANMVFAETSNTTGEAANSSAPQEQRVINADSDERICRDANDDLGSMMSELSKACTSTNRGRCIDDVMRCHEGNSDSETCKELEELSSNETKDDIDRKIEKLKDRKDKVVDKQDEVQDEIDELEEEALEKDEEILEAQEEQKEAQDQLKEKLNEQQNSIADQARKIQEGIEAIQNEINATHQKAIEAEVAMSDLILQERIRCNKESGAMAQEFTAYYRQCMSSTSNCSFNQESLLALGNKSLNDLARAYKRRAVRKCMAINNDTEFGLKYKQARYKVGVQKRLLQAQRNQLKLKQNQLEAHAIILKQRNDNEQTQALLSDAQNANQTSQKVQAILMAKEVIMAKITAKKKKLEDYQKLIDSYDEEIQDLEDKKAKALKDEELRNFRLAMNQVSSIVSKARSYVKQCGCDDQIESINRYAGDTVCNTNSTSPTQSSTPSFQLLEEGTQ